MESDYLILRRASAFRPSGEWNDDDYDVLCNGVVVGRIMQGGRRAGGLVVDVDARLRTPRGPHADAWLCRNARGRDGGVCKELEARMKKAPDEPGL